MIKIKKKKVNDFIDELSNTNETPFGSKVISFENLSAHTSAALFYRTLKMRF